MKGEDKQEIPSSNTCKHVADKIKKQKQGKLVNQPKRKSSSKRTKHSLQTETDLSKSKILSSHVELTSDITQVKIPRKDAEEQKKKLQQQNLRKKKAKQQLQDVSESEVLHSNRNAAAITGKNLDPKGILSSLESPTNPDRPPTNATQAISLTTCGNSQDTTSSSDDNFHNHASIDNDDVDMSQWNQFCLHENIINGLREQKFISPTPIQV